MYSPEFLASLANFADYSGCTDYRDFYPRVRAPVELVKSASRSCNQQRENIAFAKLSEPCCLLELWQHPFSRSLRLVRRH